MELFGVTSFSRWKDVTNTCKLFAGFPKCNGGKSEESEDFKCIFIVCCVLASK